MKINSIKLLKSVNPHFYLNGTRLTVKSQYRIKYNLQCSRSNENATLVLVETLLHGNLNYITLKLSLTTGDLVFKQTKRSSLSHSSTVASFKCCMSGNMPAISPQSFSKTCVMYSIGCTHMHLDATIND